MMKFRIRKTEDFQRQGAITVAIGLVLLIVWLIIGKITK
jgi:hypothetical protein